MPFGGHRRVPDAELPDHCGGRRRTFRFAVALPVEVNLAPIAAHTDRSSDPTIAGMSILVVDDNATNRRIFEETLAGWGARAVLADGGPAALAALRAASARGEPIAAALIDGMMPGMDGFGLAAAIQAEPDPAIAAIPRLLLTSAGRPDDPSACLRLGISAALTKPVRRSDLYNALIHALATAPNSAAAAPLTEPAPVDPSEPHAGLRILLAEDHPVNQKVAQRMLERLGHSVLVVGDGRQAVEAHSRSEFDLILMDVQMPEMDGFEALAAIRDVERSTGRHLPIIALTAHAMKGDRERCLAAGFDDYLAKPIRQAALQSLLLTPVAPA